MSQTKHTPGPWFVHDGTSHSKDSRGYVGTFDIKTSPKGELHNGTIWIGDTKPYDDPGFTDKETAHANAKLIAAAPEMLSALQQIVKGQQGETKSDFIQRMICLAEEVIEKATT